VSALLICTGGGIGDVLLATPVARALRTTYGDVVALTTAAHRAVLDGNPDLGEVWTADTLRADAERVRAYGFAASVTTWATVAAALLPVLGGVPERAGQARRPYSRLFNRRVVVRSELGDRTTHWTQILLDYARALGCETPRDALPSFAVSAFARAGVRRTLAEAGVKGSYIVLHPTRGISGARERWPVARLAELARTLRTERGATVVVTGAGLDRAIADVVAAAGAAVSLGGRTSLAEFGALAAGAAAVVAMDSGPMHVAAAVGAPTVGIFALQTDEPDRWAPLGPRATVVRATYPCPAWHRKETCPDFACVAALEIPRVLAALDRVARIPAPERESSLEPPAVTRER